MRFDRLMLFSVVALGLIVEATAQSSPNVELGMSRPGGVYTSLTTTDIAACASACASDNLCMAWTRLDSGACELKAVVPRAIVQANAASGLSQRAPDFARQYASLSPAAPAAQTAAPQHETTGVVAVAQAAPPQPAHKLDDDALLGGPEQETADLRPRLGGAGSR